MKEIFPNLFIGNQDDYESLVRLQDGWKVVHACKEPYHRRALGYSTRGAPKDHPEYLIAYRDNEIILNMVDAADVNYIPKELVDEALKFINIGLKNNQKVLVHCNLGESRSPAIGFLYLLAYTEILPKESIIESVKAFKNLYPGFNPSLGIQGFLQRYWSFYLQ